MDELISNEEKYFAKLTEEQKQIYSADYDELHKLRALNDLHVNMFVDIAQLLKELHRVHSRYNYLTEKFGMHADNEHTIDLEMLLDEAFGCPISIGYYSAVISLSNMENCDAMCVLLAQVKMNQFDMLLDYCDVNKSFNTLLISI